MSTVSPQQTTPRLEKPRRISEHNWPDGTSIVASVICPTYNQENFIGQCIEGLLMQKTTFPVEIIIHDDASTDRTADIIRAYCARHPRIFRSVLRTENQMQLGRNFMPSVYDATRGEYVAFCEGDDYWTAADKLQKQIDFLDGHPECSMCFHNVLVVNEGATDAPRPAHGSDMRSFYHLRDLLPWNFIHTPSTVFRKNALIRPLPDWYYLMPMGDWPIYLLLAQQGSIGYLPEVMAAYRVHSGGIWSQMSSRTSLEKHTLAAEIVLREVACKFPETARGSASLRREALRMYSELGDYLAASIHARKLLRHVSRNYLGDIRSLSRRYLVEMRSLLITILRAHCPWLWHALRRMKNRF